MRFVYNDPYALRSAVEQLVGQPVATMAIVVPRRRQHVAHTIKVEVGKATDTSRIVMEKAELLDAVKGKGYREVETKTNRRKAPSR